MYVEALPWICPKCFDLLGLPGMPQAEALNAYKKHKVSGICGKNAQINKVEKKRRSKSPHAHPISRLDNGKASTGVPAGSIVYVPPKRNNESVQSALSATTLSRHDFDTTFAGIPVGRLFHAVLPPGERPFWTAQCLSNHYRSKTIYSTRRSTDLSDVGRLKAIALLRPTKMYVGTELWKGYRVFQFANTPKVVLDTPVENNAIYVLNGDWQNMVALSKQALLTRYKYQTERIVHTGNWADRLRDTVYARKRPVLRSR